MSCTREINYYYSYLNPSPMLIHALQRRWKCKRQLEGAEGEGGVRGWVEDEEDEVGWRTRKADGEDATTEAAPEGEPGAATGGHNGGCSRRI